MIKLSLIIPYHNEPEDDLNRLISTIQLQQEVDFNQIEIVVSNNSENPIEPSFLKQQLFPNASYYTTNNGLTGPNRQNGIIHSKGEYFSLLDSDDTLSDLYAIRDMLKIIDENPSYDIYYFQELQQFTNGKEYIWSTIDCPEVTIHGKVYKKDFIIRNNIEHLKDIRFSEDTLFNLNCEINNPSILYVDRIVYLTYFNPNSSSNKDWDYFVKEASYSHCKGTLELAHMYKNGSTAVFNILVRSLLDFQERLKEYIDLSLPVKIVIYTISQIIESINIDEIENKDVIPYI